MTSRWWGKPFGWLLWAAFAVIVGDFLLVVAALVLSVVGWRGVGVFVERVEEASAPELAATGRR